MRGEALPGEGCPWAGHFDGARLIRFTPDGRADRAVPLPSPTAVCFGDDGLDGLFVTLARIDMTLAVLR